MHYRVPLWDSLIERGAGAYRISVLGPLQNGKAFGGDYRPYFRQLACKTVSIFGQSFASWPGAAELVRRERPEVVIFDANPRNATCWRLPAVCRRIGAASVCWTKVHSYSGIPRRLLIPMKRRFLSRFDRALCYGEQSLAELVSLGFPADHARVAQNTIDTRRIFEQARALSEQGRELRKAAAVCDKHVLLCVGRVVPEKRHADLLRAWSRLRQLDPDLVLVLVGGDRGLEEIRREAGRIDPMRIIVTGPVPEGEDYAWIATADITVYPGAVGLAINQSLALGRPTVIADEIGADSEILEHGVTGWRYPKGDLDALVRVIRDVLNDDEATRRVTDTARALMREQVTIENMVEVIDATIREAIDISRTRKRSL